MRSSGDRSWYPDPNSHPGCSPPGEVLVVSYCVWRGGGMCDEVICEVVFPPPPCR